MKSISAAIIVFAGAVLFAVGALCRHGDTGDFAILIGGGLGVAGLWVWFGSLKDK